MTESEVCFRKINTAAIHTAGLEEGQLEIRRPEKRLLERQRQDAIKTRTIHKVFGSTAHCSHPF